MKVLYKQDIDLDEAIDILKLVNSKVTNPRESFEHVKTEATNITHTWHFNTGFEAKRVHELTSNH